MTKAPYPIRRRIAIVLQMAFGAVLITLAVSTQFDFSNPQQVELHVFEGISARVALPGIIVTVIKGALAFAGSWLLMRRDLVMPPSSEISG